MNVGDSPLQNDSLNTARALVDGFVSFLDAYPSHPAKFSSDAAQFQHAKSLSAAFAKVGQTHFPEGSWKGDASVGKGVWAATPWVALYDTRETERASSGVYPVAHFLFARKDGTPGDLPGVRVGLGVSSTEFPADAGPKRVKEVAIDLQDLGIQDYTPFWFSGTLQPRQLPRPEPGLSRDYYDGMVLEKFFSIDDLKAQRDETVYAISDLVRWYYNWAEFRHNGYPDDWFLPQGFLEVMERYRTDGTVFWSSKQPAPYSVSTVKDDGCDILRLDGGESTRCTATGFQSKLLLLREKKGAAPFDPTFNSTSAIRAGYLQAPCFALSRDRGDIQLISKRSQALEVFCDYCRNLRVDKSSGAEKKYKPAMVAAVLEAIVAGELNENRIEFDAILPRFHEKINAWKLQSDDVNAAYAFYHLSSEPFWVLSYPLVDSRPMPVDTSAGLSPATLRANIKFASLKDTFWRTFILDTSLAKRALTEVEKRWAPENKLKIDEELLRLAVEKTLRPAFIDQGALKDLKWEGYHHQRILPTAAKFLTEQAIAENVKDALKGALGASENLLSAQFEKSAALDFVASANVDELREKTQDLIFGTDSIADRFKRFATWAKRRPKETENKQSGFNPTTISYLLAVSNPTLHAFCKPEAYAAAVSALLGSEVQGLKDHDRQAQADQFYAEILTRLQSYELPVSDLMHVHIAFYLLHKSARGLPTWSELRMPTPEKKTFALNQILYGPPGTGKTYQSVERAVCICAGVPFGSLAREEIQNRFEQLRQSGRIEFITFHQSYSYEEFVEGIRPVLDEEESASIRYECAPGVFKKICVAAQQSVKTEGVSEDHIFKDASIWKMALKNDADDIINVCLDKKVLLLGWGKGLDFSSCNTEKEVHQKLLEVDPAISMDDSHVRLVHKLKNEMKIGDIVIVPKGLNKIRAIGQVTSDYQFRDEFEETWKQSRSVEWLKIFDEPQPRELLTDTRFTPLTIYKLQRESIKLDKLHALLSGSVSTALLPYVIIVDEINRGNISKVFGELITLIEDDKRLGAENALQARLPYSKELFGVPENLHILGTMNTSDRSIAVVDIALRRRFVFEELMPDYGVLDSKVGTVGGISVSALLKVLNERIECLYDRDHQIGHAFFIRVKTLADLRNVLCDKVYPLLHEYFYGQFDRIAAVLGCPFDESGKPMNSNSSPLLKVTKLNSGWSEIQEARMSVGINPDFKNALDNKLGAFFTAAMKNYGNNE